jgi:beta-glucanase (GH16 family)
MKQIKKNFLLVLLHIVCIASNFSTPSIAGWELQWVERFDGNEVDWNNWTAQIQANFNAEEQCYTDDDSSDNKNYDVSDGTLKIIARRQTINCPGLSGSPREWTSGRINSKDKREFLYGRIESRIRFLNLEAGTWPAFWMLENRIYEDPIANDNDFITWPNPGAGEIDVWEWFANNPGSYITNFFNTNGCGNEVRYTYPDGSSQVQQWHDYAIEWDTNSIKFFIDDVMVTSHDVSACSQYKEPMFVLLNVAMGGNLGGNIHPLLNMATMEVDYVAHCHPTNANAATRCNENTPAPGNAAPAITSNPITTVDANEVYSYTLKTSDADGDALTLAATVLPGWLSFDILTGVLTGTPAKGDAGNHNVTLIVSDGTDSIMQTFSITVPSANTPPSITSSASDNAIVGVPYSFTLLANDADDDSLTLSVISKPDWLSFNSTSGVLTGTPTAIYALTSNIVYFMVSDGKDNLSQRFTINVFEAQVSDNSGDSPGGGSTDLLFFLFLGILMAAKKLLRE